jgi:hypothetical protein
MPPEEFEPKISVLEWAKIFHALECAATVLGNFDTDRSKEPASRPGRFTTDESVSGTDCIADWVGPATDLDAVMKKNMAFPCRKSKPCRAAHSCNDL